MGALVRGILGRRFRDPFEKGRISRGQTLERGARGMLGEFPTCSVAVDYLPTIG